MTDITSKRMKNRITKLIGGEEVDLTQWGLDTDKLIDALGPIIKAAASEAIIMAIEDKASLWIEVKAEDTTDSQRLVVGLPFGESEDTNAYWSTPFLDIIEDTINDFNTCGDTLHPEDRESIKRLRDLLMRSVELVDQALSKPDRDSVQNRSGL